VIVHTADTATTAGVMTVDLAATVIVVSAADTEDLPADTEDLPVSAVDSEAAGVDDSTPPAMTCAR
jgi:hypothetical protein